MEFKDALRSAMGDESQASLADRTGLRQATISRLLSGKAEPEYRTLIALYRALPALQALVESSIAATGPRASVAGAA